MQPFLHDFASLFFFFIDCFVQMKIIAIDRKLIWTHTVRWLMCFRFHSDRWFICWHFILWNVSHICFFQSRTRCLAVMNSIPFFKCVCEVLSSETHESHAVIRVMNLVAVLFTYFTVHYFQSLISDKCPVTQFVGFSGCQTFIHEFLLLFEHLRKYSCVQNESRSIFWIRIQPHTKVPCHFG